MLTEDIRAQDRNSALSSALGGNPENVDIVYDYVTLNMQNWATKLVI
jgi:hypothetical protein